MMRSLSFKQSARRAGGTKRKVRVSSRPTLLGAGFAGIALCCLLLAINFSNNLLFGLSFLLLSVLAVDYAVNLGRLKDLIPGAWRIDPVFAGQSVTIGLGIEDVSDRSHGELALCTQKGVIGHPAYLPPKERVTLTLSLPTDRRGHFEPPGLSIDSIQPFGLFRSRLTLINPPAYWVYPRPDDRGFSPHGGPWRQRKTDDQDLEFSSIRNYVPGDPLSRIAWKASARSDDLLSKDISGDMATPALHLDWAATQPGSDEDRLSQLTSWVLDTELEGREYALKTPEGDLPAGTGDGHMRACLQHLASFGQEPGPA